MKSNIQEGLAPLSRILLILILYIMEKKRFYVVTETIVGFEKKSVNTFIKGISEELDNAQSILSSSKETLIEDGFEKSLISDFNGGWVYKSDYSIIQDQILIEYV